VEWSVRKETKTLISRKGAKFAKKENPKQEEDDSDKNMRIFRAIDACFFARSAVDAGWGATTTQQAGTQRRRAREADAEPRG